MPSSGYDEDKRLYDRLSKVLRLPGKLDELIVFLSLDPAYLNESAPPARLARLILDQLTLREPPELDRLAPLLGLGPKPVSPKQPSSSILILAANPVAGVPLQLDREAGLIRENLSRGEAGRAYAVEVVRATTASELSDYFLRLKPELVHFSGHGLPTGELVLVDPTGTARPVDADAISRLFAALPTKPKCVVLNACYSRVLATKLAVHVEFVVGMSRAIGDSAAPRFSEGFYRGIAYGNDSRTAFDLGCAQVGLAGLPDAVVPHFTTRGTDHVALPEALEISRDRPDVDRGPAQDGPRLYPLWFGTNRRPLDRLDPASGFGLGDDQRLHYGTCQVAVPRSHKIGSIGSPFWKRWLSCTDDRLRLVRVEHQAEDDFWEGVRGALSEWGSIPKTAVCSSTALTSASRTRPAAPLRSGSTSRSPASWGSIAGHQRENSV